MVPGWVDAMIAILLACAVAGISAYLAYRLGMLGNKKKAGTKATCPEDSGGRICSNHGTCANNNCSCDLGWMGKSCNEPAVQCAMVLDDTGGLAECSGHGDCVFGACNCGSTYFGVNCEEREVTCATVDGVACSGQGTCNALGKCDCNAGFTGSACQRGVGCPSDCNGAGGTCSGAPNYTCSCAGDYAGDDCTNCDSATPGACTTPPASKVGSGKCAVGNGKECGGNGTCDESTGACACAHGFVGVACTGECPKNSLGDYCSTPFNCGSGTLAVPASEKHGACEEGANTLGVCVCEPGYGKDDVTCGGCVSGFTAGSAGLGTQRSISFEGCFDRPTGGSATVTQDNYEGACVKACPGTGGFGVSAFTCYGNGTCLSGGNCACFDAQVGTGDAKRFNDANINFCDNCKVAFKTTKAYGAKATEKAPPGPVDPSWPDSYFDGPAECPGFVDAGHRDAKRFCFGHGQCDGCGECTQCDNAGDFPFRRTFNYCATCQFSRGDEPSQPLQKPYPKDKNGGDITFWDTGACTPCIFMTCETTAVVQKRCPDEPPTEAQALCTAARMRLIAWQEEHPDEQIPEDTEWYKHYLANCDCVGCEKNHGMGCAAPYMLYEDAAWSKVWGEINGCYGVINPETVHQTTTFVPDPNNPQTPLLGDVNWCDCPFDYSDNPTPNTFCDPARANCCIQTSPAANILGAQGDGFESGPLDKAISCDTSADCPAGKPVCDGRLCIPNGHCGVWGVETQQISSGGNPADGTGFGCAPLTRSGTVYKGPPISCASTDADKKAADVSFRCSCDYPKLNGNGKLQTMTWNSTGILEPNSQQSLATACGACAGIRDYDNGYDEPATVVTAAMTTQATWLPLLETWAREQSVDPDSVGSTTDLVTTFETLYKHSNLERFNGVSGRNFHTSHEAKGGLPCVPGTDDNCIVQPLLEAIVPTTGLPLGSATGVGSSWVGGHANCCPQLCGDLIASTAGGDASKSSSSTVNVNSGNASCARDNGCGSTCPSLCTGLMGCNSAGILGELANDTKIPEINWISADGDRGGGTISGTTNVSSFAEPGCGYDAGGRTSNVCQHKVLCQKFLYTFWYRLTQPCGDAKGTGVGDTGTGPCWDLDTVCRNLGWTACSNVVGQVACAFSKVHSCCFVGSAMVTMADGSRRPISTVRADDLVMDGSGKSTRVVYKGDTIDGRREAFGFSGVAPFTTTYQWFVGLDGQGKEMSFAVNTNISSHVRQARLVEGTRLVKRKPDGALRIEEVRQIEHAAISPEVPVHFLVTESHTFVVEGFVVRDEVPDAREVHPETARLVTEVAERVVGLVDRGLHAAEDDIGKSAFEQAVASQATIVFVGASGQQMKDSGDFPTIESDGEARTVKGGARSRRHLERWLHRNRGDRLLVQTAISMWHGAAVHVEEFVQGHAPHTTKTLLRKRLEDFIQSRGEAEVADISSMVARNRKNVHASFRAALDRKTKDLDTDIEKIVRACPVEEGKEKREIALSSVEF